MTDWVQSIGIFFLAINGICLVILFKDLRERVDFIQKRLFTPQEEQESAHEVSCVTNANGME